MTSEKGFYNWESGDEIIICPYCGKKYEPTYEETYIGDEAVDCYKEGEIGEFTCDGCGKKFRLSADMKWKYFTETIDGEMTKEEHDEWKARERNEIK